MNRLEATSVGKLATGFFAEMTNAQIDHLVDDILTPMSYERACAVVKTVGSSSQTFEFGQTGAFPRLVGELTADHAKYLTLKADRSKERIIDWLRNGNAISPEEFDSQTVSDLADDDLITLHYSTAWQNAKHSTAEESAKQSLRKMIRGHAEMALLQIGHGEEAAKRAAEICVELEPG